MKREYFAYMANKIRLVYLLSTLLTIVLTGLLIFDLVEIRKIQKIQRQDAKLSLVWYLTQADREARTFLQNTSFYYLGLNGVTRQKFLMSFDIFWSRYDKNINQHIQQMVKSVESGTQTFKSSREILIELEPLVQKLRPGDIGTLNKIIKLSTLHLEKLYDLSILSLQIRQFVQNQRLITIEGLYFDLLITMFSLIFSGVLAIGFFLRKGRQLKEQNIIFEQRVCERTEALNLSNESLLIEASVRKLSEKKSQQLISAFNQSKEVVFFLDADNCFIFFNESFKALNKKYLHAISIGSQFDIYLQSVVDDRFCSFNQEQKKMWISDWLDGLYNTVDLFEVTFVSGQQYIFNIDRLEDESVIVIGANISTLKTTQAALAKSESRFRNFALIGADWYWEMDAELRFTFMAGGVEKISGLSPEFFVGTPKDESFGVSGYLNQHSMNLHIEKVKTQQSFQDHETKWKREDGKMVTISVSGEPRYNKSGQFIGYIGAGRDVTARCLVEEHDKRLIAAINSLNLMITIYDDDDKLIFYNQEFNEFRKEIDSSIDLGISFAGQWRKTCDYFSAEYGLDADYWFARRLALYRQCFSDFVLPLGSDRYINVFEQILDDGGVIIIATDISKSKRAEQEIISLRNYLSNIIDSISSIIIGVDEYCLVTQWNLAAEKETGICLKDAYHKNLLDIFPRLTNELPKITEAISVRQESHQSKRLFLRDGKACYEDISIYPLVTGNESGAVIRLDDVTEQVLISEMMIQTEKMLSVGGLAAGMAHEINNPLAGMMQTARVMVNRLSNDNIYANVKVADKLGIKITSIDAYMQQRGILEMLNNIVESGKRVAAIVENMLDFSRQSTAGTGEQNIACLLDKAVELSLTDHNLKNNYEFKNITIVRNYQSNVPLIVCEGGKIEQVFLNILRNAAQAMQEAAVDSPKLILTITFDKQQQQVMIEIEDNGPGIDEETKRRVFEPFFTTKKEGLGTGLGLSVSYFIITENHGGKLTVDSLFGKCTKFTICLLKKGKTTA